MDFIAYLDSFWPKNLNFLSICKVVPTDLYIPGLLFEGSKIKLVIITEANIAYLATDY